MKFRILLAILLVWAWGFCFEANAQTQISFVANGTDSSQYFPYYINHPHSVNEMIYLQSQIQRAGHITKLSFYKERGVDVPVDNVTIYLKTTQDTAFTFGSIDTTGFTRVFSGEIPHSTIYTGWREIVLDSAFYYDNASNLQLIFRRNWSIYNAGVTGNIPFYVCTLNAGRYASRRVSNLYPLTASSILVPETVLPNLKLEFSAVAGTRESTVFSGVLVFPNPASSSLTISGAQLSGEIKIKDLVGREIKVPVRQQANNVSELNISNLPAGAYILEGKADKKLFRRKFIKL